MPTVPITLVPGNLPEGYCYPSDPQQLNHDIITIAQGTVPGGGGGTVILGSATPSAPTDLTTPWLRTDSSGVIDGWYTWLTSAGGWVRPYPTPPGGFERRLWVGTTDQLKTYDGGNGDSHPTPTDTSGAFWEVDTTFAGSVPIGPATISTLVPPLVINVGSTGGNASVLLDATTMPSHNHLLPFYLNDATATPHQWDTALPQTSMGPTFVSRTMQASDIVHPGGSDTPNYQIPSYPAGGTSGSTQVPVNLLNPFVGTYFIKRTIRKYYFVGP